MAILVAILAGEITNMSRRSEKKEMVRVNRALGQHANFMFLDSTHLVPAGLSVIFGIGISQLLKLSFLWHLLLVIGPFAAWIIIAGPNPKRYLTQFEIVPKWTRRRINHRNALHKKRAGRVKRGWY